MVSYKDAEKNSIMHLLKLCKKQKPACVKSCGFTQAGLLCIFKSLDVCKCRIYWIFTPPHGRIWSLWQLPFPKRFSTAAVKLLSLSLGTNA